MEDAGQYMQQSAYFTFGIQTETPPSLDARVLLPRAEEISTLTSLLNDVHTHTILLTGAAGTGKSTLAALLFHQYQRQMLEDMSGFRHCIWLRPGPRTTWPDLINALLNALQAPGPEDTYFSQRLRIQALYETLRRPGQGALVVLDQCEEMFERAIEPQHQETPYAVGIGLSGAVRFLEMLQQDLGESRVLLTCTSSPFGSNSQEMPGVREYIPGGVTLTEGIHLLQQHNVRGLQQDLSTVWQRCSGHIYSLVMFSILKNLNGLSLHYLVNSPAYQILWDGSITQNLLEAVVSFLTPIQMSLVRALCLFREAPPVEGIIEVATGERTRQETDYQLFEREITLLAALGLIEPVRRADGETGYQLHALFSKYLLNHYLDSEQRRASGYLSSSLGVTDQPAPLQVNQEARQIAQAAGHIRIANYYKRIAQICPPSHLRSSPNDVVPLLAMLEHLCLGWHWQVAYDQLYAQELDEALLRWEIWHTLIQLYEMMLPPAGSLQRRDEGLVCSALGVVYNRLGEQEQSRTYFTSALAIQRDMGDQEGEAITLTNQGEVLRALGDIETANRNFEQALSLLRPQENPELTCVLTHNLALLAQQQRDFPQSLHYFLQVLQMVRQSQDRVRESMILTNIGLLLCEQQRYQEGLALLLPALQHRHAIHDPNTDALVAFLNKLEQRMGREAFAHLRLAAQAEGQQEQVLRMLTV